ncbi:DUF6166 domain-containing protein [Fimbriiglobus ruber]|uniref:Uncharacterized protein n=1 Tax=Fimbriiglobus ruber TaxID=1908690 RepID=A0A225DXZ1_9BACT|nr:DUF6166 domain-containing protein [Fimbriiglobus ruber]OWK40987.1 hypothetical protein FRUB_04879 [Fimbriiglobus ruber]
MKVYRGQRTHGGWAVTVDDGTSCRTLDPRLDLKTHSRSGFAWGHAANGSAQLALALVADALGHDDRAEALYQRFQFNVVEVLPPAWTLTENQIRAAVRDIERARTKLIRGPARDVSPDPSNTRSSTPDHTHDVRTGREPGRPAGTGTPGPGRGHFSDAFALGTIALSPAADGPKARLLRSVRLNQLQLRFDEKPAAKYATRLRENGWQGWDAEQAWTLPFDPEYQRWRTHAAAEKLFTEIGNEIRADAGLPPVRPVSR